MLDDILVMVLAGGRRRTALPADQGTRQAGRLFRRPVPDHRLHAEQLHQLRPAPDLHRAAVQVAVAQPPPAHGLERRRRRARRVHRDPAARRSGSASTGIRAPPTPSTRTSIRSFARTRSSSSCSPAITSTRWTTRRCCASTRSAAPARRWRCIEVPSEEAQPLRRAAGRRATDRITGFLEKPKHLPPGDQVARLDGHLHLRHVRAGAGARGGCAPQARQPTTSARTSFPG